MLKKILFVIAAFFALLSWGQLFSWAESGIGMIVYVVLLAAYLALLVRLVLRFRKQEGEDRRKTWRRIVWLVLLPVFVALAIGIFVIVSLFLYF